MEKERRKKTPNKSYSSHFGKKIEHDFEKKKYGKSLSLKKFSSVFGVRPLQNEYYSSRGFVLTELNRLEKVHLLRYGESKYV